MMKHDLPARLHMLVSPILDGDGRMSSYRANFPCTPFETRIPPVPLELAVKLLQQHLPDVRLASWQSGSNGDLQEAVFVARAEEMLLTLMTDMEGSPDEEISAPSTGATGALRVEGYLRVNPSHFKSVGPLLEDLITLSRESDHSVWVSCIVSMGHGLGLRRFALSLPDKPIPFDTAYGPGFEGWHASLRDMLLSTTHGLVLLHGPAGTGKTSYIRHLLRDVKGQRDALFVTRALAHDLASPGVIPLILNMIQGGRTPVLVIEDAEHLLMSRDASDPGGSDLVSLVLNLSDGLLNDLCKCQVIATFNTDIKNVDPALLRRGRLLTERKFEALPTEHAQALARYVGSDPHGITKPTVLADVLGTAPLVSVTNFNKPPRQAGFM